MAELDEELEKRVWQRVRGQEQALPLQSLAAAEKSGAGMYLMLSRMMQGRQKELLRQLYHREQNHSRLLNGISILRDGKALTARPIPPEGQRVEHILRRCYAGCLKARQEYEKYMTDPEYGAIFARMAREEQENGAMILEILGFQ